MFVTFCSLFTNRLRPFRDFIHHTVTSINHHSHRRHEMFRACHDFCTFLSRTVLNTFTLQMCSCISACLYLIVSRHCSLQFIRSSCLFVRTPTELFFVVAIFSWQTFGASLFPVLLLFKCFEHRNDDVWLKRPVVLLFLDQQQHECRMSLTPVSHHQQLWSMISVCVLSPPISVNDSVHTWTAIKRASHAPLTLTMWNSNSNIVVNQEKDHGVWIKIAIF